MIISVSRRTDIPARYTPWFFQRLKEGYALVRTPYRPHSIQRISLSPDVVDGFVFWTKNPAPMLTRLQELESYPYYFQCTVTPYGSQVEPGIPSKQVHVLPALLELSRRIGSERVLWRYDPIFFNIRYTPEYHLHAFGEIARMLEGAVRHVTISFLDYYQNTEKVLQPLQITPMAQKQRLQLAAGLSAIAGEYGMSIGACAEPEDFSACGIARACCIDAELLGRISGCPLDAKKDSGQRLGCGCAESIDIGMYDTCPNGCLYCYANHHRSAIERNAIAHNANSPLLCGELDDGDTVYVREMRSLKQPQINFL